MQAENSASAANTAAGRASDVSARLQHLRNLLNSQRNGNGNGEDRRALDALDREMSAEPMSVRLDRRRRDLEAQLHGHDASPTSDVLPTSIPSSLVRSRRRAIRPSEMLQRHRDRLNQLFQGEAMEETSPIIERPPPPLEPSEVVIQEILDEAQVMQENRWRAKRRKLDDGTFEEEAKTFSYGHKGQVVPGPLKMEIISCDGGEYSEPNVGSSLPQHVLQDDPTVYCTKSNRCNMLLKHVGGMPISLTGIVIKAPDNGYDAPIQEGMIFVSLTDDKLLEKTSQYEIRYSPKSYRYHHRRTEPHELRFRPSHEYMNSTRSPLRSIDRTSLRDPYPPRPSTAETDHFLETALVPGFHVSTSFDSHSDTETAEPTTLSRPSNLSDFNPDQPYLAYSDRYRPRYSDRYPIPGDTGSSDDEEEDEEEEEEDDRSLERRAARDIDATLTRQRRLLDRMRMQHPRDSSSEWDGWTREYFRLELDHGTNRRSTPSRIEVRTETQIPEDLPASLPAEVVDVPGSASTLMPVKPAEPLAPHARFFIRRDKSSVSIKFDPPVAGRYILIKLWAPCPNANIDIQSIKAYGYGGPRFFPSREMR